MHVKNKHEQIFSLIAAIFDFFFCFQWSVTYIVKLDFYLYVIGGREVKAFGLWTMTSANEREFESQRGQQKLSYGVNYVFATNKSYGIYFFLILFHVPYSMLIRR